MWPNPQVTTDLVTFTEEILNRNLHFLSSGIAMLSQCIVPYITKKVHSYS